MQKVYGISRLTPFTVAPCEGYVHSVFLHSANLLVRTSKREERMVTLTLPNALKVPDSIELSSDIFGTLDIGMTVQINESRLIIDEFSVPLTVDLNWTGYMPEYCRKLTSEALMECQNRLACGLDSLSSSHKKLAEAALLTPEATDWVGLGKGLTPSYDDALVGVMAVYRSVRHPLPFDFSRIDYDNTTDVSARYLRLAAAGFFGEPLLMAVEALYGLNDLNNAMAMLKQVGATSGWDMLYGISKAVEELFGIV